MVMIGCYLDKACLLVLDVTFSFMLHQFYQSHLYLSILSSVPKNFTLYPKLDLKLFIYSHAKINNWIGVQQPSILVRKKPVHSVLLEDTFPLVRQTVQTVDTQILLPSAYYHSIFHSSLQQIFYTLILKDEVAERCN